MYIRAWQSLPRASSFIGGIAFFRVARAIRWLIRAVREDFYYAPRQLHVPLIFIVVTGTRVVFSVSQLLLIFLLTTCSQTLAGHSPRYDKIVACSFNAAACSYAAIDHKLWAYISCVA